MIVPESVPPVQQKTVLPVFDAAEPRALFGKATLLLAEDDDDLRYVMECTLKAMGYFVIACANAEAASLAFRSYSFIDVLLTDFSMPGKSGAELARELTALRPALPVMIITGSVLASDMMNEIAERHWTYVSKPYNLLALRASLQRVASALRSAAWKGAASEEGSPEQDHRFTVREGKAVLRQTICNLQPKTLNN